MSKKYGRQPSDSTSYGPVAAAPAKWGVGIKVPLLIIGSIAGAIALAIMHHFMDDYLDGRPAAGFWNQAKTRRLENALSTIVRILLSFSATVCLYQVVS